MAGHREELEQAFAGTIIWQPLKNKKASRIKYEISKEDFGSMFVDERKWDELIPWFRDAMARFYRAVSPIWERVQRELG